MLIHATHTEHPEELLAGPAISAGLNRVEKRLNRLSTSSRLPLINRAAGRITGAGGKRLRPALTLASALALGGRIDRRTVTAAACVELIHAGSLVHDDLMDNAAERRGVRTVNAELGNGGALVVGDFMVARAWLAALSSTSRAVAETLATTLVELAEGQFQETAALFDAGRTPADALESVRRKTASLFRTSCVVAHRDGRAMAEYGERFGMLFQILDDLLDLASTAGRLGKPVGNDLRQGVYSFPLLTALGRDCGDLRPFLGRRLTEDEITAVLTRLRESSMAEETVGYCRALAAEAVAALPDVTDPEAAAVLRGLPPAYVDRAEALLVR
ncbi:heptaprenyl diphosphate synthase subunit II [Planobispora rosea]|uniref:Heptaprenyl diphosphate synthase subunit II n=1 Tax=Planobispora rosea TaxID=35762 RepID=A0A8J3SB49_PLARO|nr:polyprenyl synthetase family protein [Planobispora rosea]GGS57886.1 heptaprenyl diphosphate synthase subunit II [Planobispora rosea]GIH88479.1 heptaprenyl diphosphate synthase subunit II [Planobispora rosea]